MKDSEKKMKVYVGCGLTGSTAEFKESVARLKDALRADFEVLDFVGLGKLSPKEVYQWDIKKCVEQCDAMIAVGDYLSTGLGYEMAVAIEKCKVPVLGVSNKKTAKVGFLRCIDSDLYEWREYDDMTEVPGMFKDFLLKFHK